MGSSINNYANSGYYQLSNMTGGQSGNTNAGTSAANLTQSLVQALSGTSSSGSSGSNDAYLLNLSPAAQAYLQNNPSSSTSMPSLSSFLNGGSGASYGGSSSFGGSGSFLLSHQQQTDITNILSKYKDAPYTQDTFNQIQSDLNAAGLGTNTLTQEDKARSFNPAIVLINALNGGVATGADTGMASDSEEQTKSSSYMQGILTQWQTISGNTGKTPTASSALGTAQTADAVPSVSSGSGA